MPWKDPTDLCACGNVKRKGSRTCRDCAVAAKRANAQSREVVAARFWRYVDKSGGPDACWPWLRFRDGDGYGKFSHDLDGKHANSAAHRMAYRLTYGEFDPSLVVCHRCDNPPCCNPAHLFLGTNQDNTADRNAKSRQARGDVLRHGHHRRGTQVNTSKLTAEQVTEIRRRHAGGEYCTALAREFGVAYNAVWCIVHRKHWKHIP